MSDDDVLQHSVQPQKKTVTITNSCKSFFNSLPSCPALALLHLLSFHHPFSPLLSLHLHSPPLPFIFPASLSFCSLTFSSSAQHSLSSPCLHVYSLHNLSPLSFAFSFLELLHLKIALCYSKRITYMQCYRVLL